MNDIRPDLLDKIKILIVDDDKFQRLVLRQIMSNCGFIKIEEATNGKQGLDKILEWRPDLVFLDENMPEMNGLEVSKTLQQKNLHNDIIIIMQTAMDKPEFKTKAFDAGIKDFIKKPLNEREVTYRIKVHLARKYSESQ